MEPVRRRRRGLVALIPILPTHRLSAAVDPDVARQSARDILDGSKYQEPRVPRPFKGILEWMADRLRPVLDLLDDVTAPVFDWIVALPGGRFILAALGVGAVAVLVRWLVARRSRSVVARLGGGGLVDPLADPAALDREADAAEAAGDHALAVRRRYEAGLLRLVRAERLILRSDTTAGSAARQVGSPVMDVLTADFEEVVYGGRQATPADSARARAGWVELLGAGVRR